jgi:predicted nucleic acid-binding protein
MSAIQTIEVYYDRIYVKGREYADMFLESLLNSAIKIIHQISPHDIREAGRFKTTYDVSLADAVVCAIALNMALPLVTSDHKELEEVERKEAMPFLWIR